MEAGDWLKRAAGREEIKEGDQDYLTSWFLGGLSLQRGRADGLADAVGHLLHVVAQVGRDLAHLQGVKGWGRGRHPVYQTVHRATAAAVGNDDASEGDGTDTDAVAPALQQLPVLLGQRAQPLLVWGGEEGRRLRNVCDGGGPVLALLRLRRSGAPPLQLCASDCRRAVVDTDAGPVRRGVAPLDRLQAHVCGSWAAAGAAGTVPGLASGCSFFCGLRKDREI